MKLPIGYVQLHGCYGEPLTPIYLKASAIECVMPNDKGGSHVLIKSHNNGGFTRIKEAPEQVLDAIDDALRREREFNHPPQRLFG